MDHVITTNDGETESIFLAYKEEQRRLRAHVSMQWQQAAATTFPMMHSALSVSPNVNYVNSIVTPYNVIDSNVANFI